MHDGDIFKGSPFGKRYSIKQILFPKLIPQYIIDDAVFKQHSEGTLGIKEQNLFGRFDSYAFIKFIDVSASCNICSVILGILK